MVTVGEVNGWLDRQAPLPLSESWDNTGLLLGDPNLVVSRILTCLTITESSANEAIERQANLVISHHPLPFKALKRITTETTAGRLLWNLARAGIAVYSPHTAWDSAENGINTMLLRRLGIDPVRPLVACTVAGLEHLGAGRIGDLSTPVSVTSIARQLSSQLGDCRPRGVDSGRLASRVAVACGSGGSLLEPAIAAGCDLFITGEATFHTCLEAQASGVSLLMIGHFASERFSLVELSERLSQAFPELDCWACQNEADPVILFN
jgi:dinuclear metal center YbgI/SA1388 family protein